MDYASTGYSYIDQRVSRRHDRPAGSSPYRRDVSPQFVSGQRNEYYTNPTFQSSVFTAHEDRRQYQDRSRSARRQGVDAHEPAQRSARGHDDAKSQVEARSVHQDDQAERHSRKSHTPTRTPHNEPSREARKSHTPVQESVTPRGEVQYRTHAFTDGYGHSHFIAEKDEGRFDYHRQHTKSPVRVSPLEQERHIEDAERQLHVTYHQEPAHVARRQGSVEKDNFYNGYNIRRAELPANDVYEATAHLRQDLQEDIFALEREMKKDYQMKLDEYHKYLDDTKDVLRSKSQLKRHEAEIARQHAALIAEEKRLEQLKQKETQIRYREMLDHQQHMNYDQRRLEKEIATAGER